ncbi:patatin family protein [Fusobacterium naviforme]|nr:patatin family protein [Fusobacterium naviforme]
MKRGLVMEGGGMRGMFTAGVIDVLMEHEIVFDGGIGTSAGAAFGCNYKSKQPGRVIRYNTEFCDDPRYGGLHSLLTTGDLYSRDFAYETVPFELYPFDSETFRRNPMEFYVVCTDVLTGRPFYKKCENGDRHDVEYMRASASMPLVSRVVEVDGHRLLDGGISDSIPLRKFISLGYDKNVVILTQPANYRKKPSRMAALFSLALRNYPAVVFAMRARHLNYNQNVAYVRTEETKGRAFVIQPEAALHISRACRDAGELMRVYELGRGAALRRMVELKRFLEE